MKKVCIIIRAYNRLEYTIQAISHIIKNTQYPNYEILVVNNNSQDGTEQWLNWIAKNSPFYSGIVKHVHCDKNYGDWGGLVYGATITDAEYVMQVDNDILVPFTSSMKLYEPVNESCRVVTDYNNIKQLWLYMLLAIMEKTEYRAVMCRRSGVKTPIPAISQSSKVTASFGNEYLCDINVYDIPRPVACFLTRRLELIEFSKKFPNIRGTKTKFEFAKFINRKVGKTNDISCMQMEGYINDNSPENYLQKKKYPQDNINCWEFI